MPSPTNQRTPIRGGGAGGPGVPIAVGAGVAAIGTLIAYDKWGNPVSVPAPNYQIPSTNGPYNPPAAPPTSTPGDPTYGRTYGADTYGTSGDPTYGRTFGNGEAGSAPPPSGGYAPAGGGDTYYASYPVAAGGGGGGYTPAPVPAMPPPPPPPPVRSRWSQALGQRIDGFDPMQRPPVLRLPNNLPGPKPPGFPNR